MRARVFDAASFSGTLRAAGTPYRVLTVRFFDIVYLPDGAIVLSSKKRRGGEWEITYLSLDKE